MQSELAKMRFKPLAYTMIPMIIIFFSLSSYYNPSTNNPDTLVGNVPFSLPETIIFKFGHNCADDRAIIEQQFGSGDFNTVQIYHFLTLNLNSRLNVYSGSHLVRRDAKGEAASEDERKILVIMPLPENKEDS